MGKLNEAKLRYLVQKKTRGWSGSRVGRDLKISPRRVNQVWNAIRAAPDAFALKRPGRKPRPITGDEVVTALRLWTEFKVSPVQLERISRLRGTPMGHNRLWRILKPLKLVRNEPKKQKRRKWVRYEREASNDLWHSDWTQLPDGQWLILFEDDASRYVLSWGVYPSCTAEASIETFDQAVAQHGLPRQVLTDKGGHFYANDQKGKAMGTSQFTKHLLEWGVEHIHSRTNHPQTNGKLEKLGGTIKRGAREHFEGDIAKTVHWYNEVRPHMSLRLNRAETPAQAYRRKLPVEHVFRQTGAWIWGE
jgi:putative transposase